MSARSISYSAEMICARRAGRKTQTRRVVDPQPAVGCHYVITQDQSGACHLHTESFAAKRFDQCYVPPTPKSASHILPCPYGQPGDRLVVKEVAWMWCAKLVSRTEVTKKTGKPKVAWVECRDVVPIYCADHPAKPTHVPDGKSAKEGDVEYCWHKKNARFLPRWASRGLDEIVSIRVERLQEISEGDAVAEGIVVDWIGRLAEKTLHNYKSQRVPAAVLQYADLWQSINGPGSWERNDWVWVVEFKVLEGGSNA